MNTLYIIRGLPGSGKSTLAKKLVVPSRHFEADMFYVVDGEYRFDPYKIKDAHEWCNESVKKALSSDGDVAVSNTFTRRWEYQSYINLAEANGFDVQVIECNGKWESVHSVPRDVLTAMRERWEFHKS